MAMHTVKVVPVLDRRLDVYEPIINLATERLVTAFFLSVTSFHTTWDSIFLVTNSFSSFTTPYVADSA